MVVRKTEVIYGTTNETIVRYTLTEVRVYIAHSPLRGQFDSGFFFFCGLSFGYHFKSEVLVTDSIRYQWIIPSYQLNIIFYLTQLFLIYRIVSR